MSSEQLNVLFLCPGNSARSFMAEAILNSLGQGRFKASSAGSYPAGQVNSFALELLQKNKLPTSELRSKNWNEFPRPDAPLCILFLRCVIKSPRSQVPYGLNTQ